MLIASVSFVIAFGIGLGGTLVVRNYLPGTHDDGASVLSSASDMPSVSGKRPDYPSVQRHSEPDRRQKFDRRRESDRNREPDRNHESDLQQTPDRTSDLIPDEASDTVSLQSPDRNIAEQKPEEKSVPVITDVDGPEFYVRKRTYSVKVHAEVPAEENAELEYILYDDSGNIAESGPSPDFTIPQSASGVYFVRVRNAGTGEVSEPYEIKGCRIQKMSAKRLEQICNSGDYTTMRNVEAYELSPDINLLFDGIPDDQKASSIDDICTRISLGIWKGVTVLEIKYDELNLVESVKFRVNL